MAIFLACVLRCLTNHKNGKFTDILKCIFWDFDKKSRYFLFLLNIFRIKLSGEAAVHDIGFLYGSDVGPGSDQSGMAVVSAAKIDMTSRLFLGIVEQIPWAIFHIFKGLVYGVPHLLIYIKMFVLACSFQIKRLLPWQIWHNSSIQDGIQDGRQL